MNSLYSGGPYAQNNGTRITKVSTKVDGGAMKAASTQNHTLVPVTPQAGSNLNTKVVAGVDLGQADWGTFVNATGGAGTEFTGIINVVAEEGTDAGYGNMALLMLNPTIVAPAVGSAVMVRNSSTGVSTTGVYNGIHRVTRILTPTNGTAVLLNTPYVYDATGISYALPVGNVANQEKNNYTMRKVVSRVHGVAENKLSYGAADYGRSKVHKVEAIRTEKVATAIRNGDYSVVSGTFSTQPAMTNDLVSMGVDDTIVNNSTNYGLKGEFVYRYGGPSGTMGDYNGKTA